MVRTGRGPWPLLDTGDRDAALLDGRRPAPPPIVQCGGGDCGWGRLRIEPRPGRGETTRLACRATWPRRHAAIGAHLVSLSTDTPSYGASSDLTTEWDEAQPAPGLNGRSELAGELEVGRSSHGSSVVRTSWVCGPHGANMVEVVLRLAAEGGPLRFVNDQRGCPTFTGDLAGMLLRLGVARRSGLFHVTNQGPTTWFDFARDVVAAAGFDPAMVEPIATSGVAAAASGDATSQLRA